MKTRKPRRHFSAEQKVSAVKRHLVEGEAVSSICEELDLHPNQFYEWQKQLFVGATQAFSNDNKREVKMLERQDKSPSSTLVLPIKTALSPSYLKSTSK